MVPKVIPASERKQPVSISLTAVEIVMLDNLAKSQDKNRSRVLADLIREQSYQECGLSAVQGHAVSVQTWTHYRTGDGRKMCFPKSVKGLCTHPQCVEYYRLCGVIQ
jgi:hypothetical protein